MSTRLYIYLGRRICMSVRDIKVKSRNNKVNQTYGKRICFLYCWRHLSSSLRWQNYWIHVKIFARLCIREVYTENIILNSINALSSKWMLKLYTKCYNSVTTKGKLNSDPNFCVMASCQYRQYCLHSNHLRNVGNPSHIYRTLSKRNTIHINIEHWETRNLLWGTRSQ
jgi:hypothetical protein